MTSPPSRLYAAYLQATRRRAVNSSEITRKQWIVIPPRLDTNVFLQFHREQPTLENRVQWKHTMVSAELMLRDLPEKLEVLMSNNQYLEKETQWLVSPIITVEMTIPEVDELYRKPTTPYKVLKRIEKVAKSKHGFTV
jgi:hypothetical protein